MVCDIVNSVYYINCNILEQTNSSVGTTMPLFPFLSSSFFHFFQSFVIALYTHTHTHTHSQTPPPARLPVRLPPPSPRYIGLDEIANEIEDPFGTDDNDLNIFAISEYVELSTRLMLEVQPTP